MGRFSIIIGIVVINISINIGCYTSLVEYFTDVFEGLGPFRVPYRLLIIYLADNFYYRGRGHLNLIIYKDESILINRVT